MAPLEFVPNYLHLTYLRNDDYYLNDFVYLHFTQFREWEFA